MMVGDLIERLKELPERDIICVADDCGNTSDIDGVGNAGGVPAIFVVEAFWHQFSAGPGDME